MYCNYKNVENVYLVRKRKTMKQIEKNTLCYYCLGCNAEEQENFRPVMRCKGFIPGIQKWQDKLREELKKK